MKKHRLSFILLGILFITSVIGLFSVEGFAQSVDIDYTFNNDNLYNSTSPSFNDFNIRNQTEYTGLYNATYSFTNDTVGWDLITSGAGSTGSVSNESFGHDKVLRLISSDAISNIYAEQVFTDNQESGTIDLWVLSTDTTALQDGFQVQPFDISFAFSFGACITNSNEFQYFDGAWKDIGLTFIANTWYHISIDFECGIGAYEGLAPDNWRVRINGIEYGDFVFHSNKSDIDSFRLWTDTAFDSVDVFFDAIGYSWDGSLIDYNLTSLALTQGTYSGNLDDANTDDANYFIVVSETGGGGVQDIDVEFILGDGLPADLSYISYHMESNTTTAVILYADGDILASGATIDDDDVELNDVNEITVHTSHISVYFHIKIYYIHLVVFDANYKVGDNIIPLKNISAVLEVDRFDWTLNGIDSAYQHGTDVINPQTWTTSNPEDLLTYSSSHFGTNDLTIDYQGAGAVGNYHTDIYKDFNIIDGRFQINWSLYYSVMENENGGQFNVSIYSYDETLLIAFNILTNSDDDSTLRYFDGSSYVVLETELTVALWYDFDLFFETNFGVLYLTNNSETKKHIIPFIDVSEGLGTVNFSQITVLDDALDNNFIFLDYIGVYVNGSSAYYEGFGYRTIDFNKPSKTWNFDEVNIYTMDANATLTIGASAGSYLVDISTFDYIAGNRTYNESTTINLYDTSSSGLLDAYLVLYIQGNGKINSMDSFNIEGGFLTQGTNEYRLEFTHSNVNINESYFYVSSNRLRGQCFYNDSNLEYIQANFDINNVLNENRSIRLKSQFSGQYGFFSLSYIDLTSSTFELPISSTSHNIILPQEKAIDEFVFLISDDNALEAGYGAGYISDIELIWNPSISITIVTISLIMVVIPLIIMIVPTLTIYSKYGKSVIMPVFILMCIICFAGGLIPAWLFFILMIGSGGFLVLRKGSDV